MTAQPKKIEAGTLHASMALAFAEIEAATKSATNPHFRSKYADLGAVIEAVKPALIAHGLFFTQHPTPSEDGVIVETVLHHASGESLSLGSLYVPANKRDAQGFGSAMTYARRYALQTAFGVPTEDDDGNAAVSTARPSTGETPPNKRVKLDGAYSSPTALRGALKTIVHNIEGFGELDEFIAYVESAEVMEAMAQCRRDMPDWWEGGDNMPAEFEPLEARLTRRKRELEENETHRNRTRTPLDAG
jgi:hypothetical protein